MSAPMASGNFARTGSAMGAVTKESTDTTRPIRTGASKESARARTRAAVSSDDL